MKNFELRISYCEPLEFYSEAKKRARTEIRNSQFEILIAIRDSQSQKEIERCIRFGKICVMAFECC